MDLSKLSDEDLQAIANDDLSSLSDGALRMIAGDSSSAGVQPPRGEAPGGFMRGLRDPIDAISQMAYEALPEGVQQAGDTASQWLHERMPSVFAPMPEQGFTNSFGSKSGRISRQGLSAAKQG